MQTFLPLPDYWASAKVLDRQRLGKQRVECKQILAALDYEIVAGELQRNELLLKRGWMNHPAVKMWRGHELALAHYMSVMIYEWMNRGYNNTLEFLDPCVTRIFKHPPWFGDEAFHASHRSNLLRKDPEHYGKFGWTESPDLEYVWPVS